MFARQATKNSIDYKLWKMRISRCSLPPIKEVRRMIEIQLLKLIYILFYGLVGITIVAIALIIVLVIIMSKSK